MKLKKWTKIYTYTLKKPTSRVGLAGNLYRQKTAFISSSREDFKGLLVFGLLPLRGSG